MRRRVRAAAARTPVYDPFLSLMLATALLAVAHVGRWIGLA